MLKQFSRNVFFFLQIFNLGNILKIVTKKCHESDFLAENQFFLLLWSTFSKILPNSKKKKEKKKFLELS